MKAETCRLFEYIINCVGLIIVCTLLASITVLPKPSNNTPYRYCDREFIIVFLKDIKPLGKTIIKHYGRSGDTRDPACIS
jgi:hypothetical protein